MINLFQSGVYWSAVSQNISKIKNILKVRRCTLDIHCLKRLGVKIIKQKSSYKVYGKGLGSFKAKKILS